MTIGTAPRPQVGLEFRGGARYIYAAARTGTPKCAQDKQVPAFGESETVEIYAHRPAVRSTKSSIVPNLRTAASSRA